jgi:RND family efflux transporter MFP subunit
LLLGLLGIFPATFLVAGCNHPAPAAQEAKPSEVVVTKPVWDEVTDSQDFTGRLDALKTVEVRAHVSGYANAIPFKEGDEVHEGELLVQIDPLPFQADFNQAEANLRQAEADWKLQIKNANRAQQLIRDRSMSKEEYDQMMAAQEKAQATVGAMKAARDRAKVYLDYTRVIAPINGRVSRRYVDPGNLIKADDTLLTTIVSEDPMYAYFDVDERTYLELLEHAGSEQGPRLEKRQLPVTMALANQDTFAQAGTINFVDNRVSATTGTIRMRGVFPNPKRLLTAGMFVRIRLPIGKPYRTLLIADEAVLSDQGRKYVYVVNDQNQVVYRSVKLGQAVGELRVVHEGLSEKDRVIVSGMQRVRPDAKVVIKSEEPARRVAAADKPSAAPGATGPASKPATATK